MKMPKSLSLFVLVILVATSVGAKVQHKEQLRRCVSFFGYPVGSDSECDRNCKGFHTNPEEEATGHLDSLGNSPKLCLCYYRCGGHISSTCRFPWDRLLKRDDRGELCDRFCAERPYQGIGFETDFNFGIICECQFDC